MSNLEQMMEIDRAINFKLTKVCTSNCVQLLHTRCIHVAVDIISSFFVHYVENTGIYFQPYILAPLPLTSMNILNISLAYKCNIFVMTL